MSNQILSFNGHCLKNGSSVILARDIQTGHIYSKVFCNGEENYVYFQQFVPKENITVNTIETWNFQQNDTGIMIFFASAEGWSVKASSVNNTHTSELVTIGDYTDVYHHTYTFDGSLTLWSNLSYIIMVNPNTNWLWESEKMYAYFGTVQDGSSIMANETWKMSAWLASNGQLRDSAINSKPADIGGFSIEIAETKQKAFMMINGQNWTEMSNV